MADERCSKARDGVTPTVKTPTKRAMSTISDKR